MNSAWIAAGLVVLGAIVAGGEALAGTAGITISPGGIKPATGDPPWDYVFEVYLDPGFEIKAFDSPLNFFQVGPSTPPFTPLVGVGADSLSSQPTDIPGGVIWTPTPTTETATWTFTGSTSNSNTGTSKLFLGEFIVETDKSYPTPPVAPGTIMGYNFAVFDIALGQTITGSSTFPLILLGVPEPSSVVMLAVGAGAMATIVVRRRRRRPGATA